MEGKSNWKPNEQSIANDWRSYHEPMLRNDVFSNIVKRLKRLFPNKSIDDQIEEKALKIEEKIYGLAKDKDDYKLKIMQRMFMTEREYKNVQAGASVNGTNTPDPAQVLNQGQLVPVSVPCTQAPTSQHCIPQQQFPSNFFHRFPAVSCSPGRQNPKRSALEIYTSYQQKKAKLTQLKHEMEELEKDIDQDFNELMNDALHTQHNHSTSWQNNGEHQGGFGGLSFQIGTPIQSAGGSPVAEWSIIDPMIEALSSEEITNSREDTIANYRISGTFQSSEGPRAFLLEDLNDTRRRSLTTHEEQNQSKRRKCLITSQTDDGSKYLESECDSTASSGSKVNKTNVENM